MISVNFALFQILSKSKGFSPESSLELQNDAVIIIGFRHIPVKNGTNLLCFMNLKYISTITVNLPFGENRLDVST